MNGDCKQNSTVLYCLTCVIVLLLIGKASCKLKGVALVET